MKISSGTDGADVSVCSACGAAVSLTSKFCGSCGTTQNSQLSGAATDRKQADSIPTFGYVLPSTQTKIGSRGIAISVVVLVAVISIAIVFWIRYKQAEFSRAVQEAQIAEQAKLIHEFEVLVSKDSTRMEMTLDKGVTGQLSDYDEILSDFDRDVTSREGTVIEVKALPQNFSPELRQGFLELLTAENDLDRAISSMNEKERDVSAERQHVSEWRSRLYNGWEPSTTQSIIIEHESRLITAANELPLAAKSVLACLHKATDAETKFQSMASKQSIHYSATVSTFEGKIGAEARELIN